MSSLSRCLLGIAAVLVASVCAVGEGAFALLPSVTEVVGVMLGSVEGSLLRVAQPTSYYCVGLG
uniref:hypothetical protein n=1 Tax=Alloprevotella sp. TaxID=1872471 RepID=UPI003FEDF808